MRFQHSTWLDSHSVLAFYLLVFVIPWAIWIPATPYLQNPRNIPLALVLAAYVGLYMPAIAALVLTGVESGKQGVGALFHRFLQWRVGFRWYLFALFSTALIGLAAIAIQVLLGGAALPFKVNIFALLILLFGGPLAEEAGWRGFALPRIQKLTNPLVAGFIVGVLWALWHLPGFIWPSLLYSAPFPFSWFLLQVVAWAILFTWLYNHTGGSLLIAFLYHFSIDASLNLLQFTSESAWLNLGLTWAVVILVIGFERTRFMHHDIARPVPSLP